MNELLSSAAKPFRVLLLGGGPVVHVLHLPALRALGWIEGSLAVDLSSTSLNRLQANAPELEVQQGDYCSLLAAPDLCERFDAALVCLPNSMHALAVEQALSAGLSVLCEKPLAMTGDDCAWLQKAAMKAGRLLSVAMVMRHLPGLQAMRNALASGLIGEVIEVEAEDGNPFSWNSDSGGYFTKTNGGVLLNMGVHYLDLLAWLFGPLEAVAYADDADGGVEANFEFHLRAKKVPVRLEVSYTRTLRNTIVVRGTEATLIFEKAQPAECRWLRGNLLGRLEVEKPFMHGRWMPTMLACYAEQLGAFAAVVRGRGKPLVSAADALATGRLIDWAGANRSPLNEAVHRVTVSQDAIQRITGRIAVTGATGFVGTRLLGALMHCHGTEVIAVVRSFRNGAMAGRLPVRLVRASLLDFDALRIAFRGARHVFHLAYGSDGPNARRTTIEGTLLACRAAVKEGAESIVVVGTTAVYGPQADGVVVDETYPLRRKGSDYELAKAEMVRQVLALATSREAGRTRITVLEPACIYGPGGKPFTEVPVSLASSGQMAWIEDGRGVANLVFVDSFVDALLRAAVNTGAHGQRFIIQDCAVTWREFLEPLLAEHGAGIRSLTAQELASPTSPGLSDVFKVALRCPDLTSKLLAWPPAAWSRTVLEKQGPGLVEKLRRIKNSGNVSSTTIPLVGEASEQAMPPRSLAGAYGPGSPKLSNAKARRVLGWEPLVPLKEGQARAVEWLRYVRLRD
jgi:predicted dehydrogenase/nucleoside-diphosphate-sugar epimerase